MGARNKIKIRLFGQELYITSADSEEYVLGIGAQVEAHILKIQETSPGMSTAMAAIFAAMDYCDDATKAKETADNLRAQLKDYLDDFTHARAALQEARRREAALSRELQSLKARLPD